MHSKEVLTDFKQQRSPLASLLYLGVDGAGQVLRAHAEYYISSGQFDRAQQLLADGAVSLEIPPESEIDTIVTALARADDTIEPDDLIDFLEVRGAADPRAQAVSTPVFVLRLLVVLLALCFTGAVLRLLVVLLALCFTGVTPVYAMVRLLQVLVVGGDVWWC